MLRQYRLRGSVVKTTTPLVEPAHFWSTSQQAIVVLRQKYLRQWLLSTIELCLLMFLISALYLGAATNPSEYTRNLDVVVVDFDNEVAGKYFLSSFRQTPPGNSTLHWRFKNPSDYNDDPDQARRDVEVGQVWAIVLLHYNTSRIVDDSVRTLTNVTGVFSSPFSRTSSPLLVIYDEARNSFTVNNYVLPPIRAAIAEASTKYGQKLRQDLMESLSSSSTSSSNTDRNIQLLNILQLGSFLVDPLSVQYQNLHPASPFVGQCSSPARFGHSSISLQVNWQQHWATFTSTSSQTSLRVQRSKPSHHSVRQTWSFHASALIECF